MPDSPFVMLVRTGSIRPADRAALKKAGIVVAECKYPSEVRFLHAEVEVSGGEMLARVLLAVKERIRVGTDHSALAAAAYGAMADTIVGAQARAAHPSEVSPDAN